MAYNTRFVCNFADLYGMDYRLEILEDGFSGLSSDILLGAGGFRLTYSGNNRGVGSLILGSKVEFDFQITTSTEKEFIKDLALSGDRDFMCRISRDEGAGHYDFWMGFIMSDLVTFQDAPFPFSFNVVASDGFGLAQDLDYTNSVWTANGKPSDVYRTHSQLLVESLSAIGVVQELNYTNPIQIGKTLLRESDQQNLSNQSKLDTTRVNTKCFVKYDTSAEGIDYEYNSVYDVLYEICKVWNARLLQWNGNFWFIPVANYLDTSAEFFPMNLNALMSAPVSQSLFITSDKYNRLVGGQFDFYPPLEKSCVEYTYYYEPFATPDANTNTCGVNIINQSYSFFDNIVPSTYTNYGDHNLNITIGYKYNNEVIDTSGNGDDPYPDDTEYVAVWRAIVSSGDYRLINDVASVDNSQNITFTTAQWLKNGSQTYENTVGTTLDISDMDCFGFPDDSNIVRVIKNAVALPLSDYTYSKVNEEITFTTSLISTDIVEVIFDYIGYGVFYYEIPELDITFNAITQSATDLVINIPFPPEEGDITIEPTGSGTTHIRGYLIPSAATTFGIDYMKAEVLNSPFGGTITIGAEPFLRVKSIEPTSITVENNLSAQPTNTSKTIKDCLENPNDSAETITIQMITGDKSEYHSDSNLEVQKTDGTWVKSNEWILSANNLSYTGSLANCINTLNLHIQEVPSLRFNGSITRSGSDLFDPIKGIKVPTFNTFEDNLFFGGGTYVAAEGIWDIQMIQLGIN